MGKHLGICGKFVKIAFILLNLLYMLIGLALVGVGSYLVHSKESLAFFTKNDFFSGAALIIMCGIAIFLITAAGIVGAVFQLRPVIGVYLVIVGVVIILEIVAGILGFVFRNTLVDTAADRATDGINEYRLANDSDYQKSVNDAIDFIQEKFECCGWTEYIEWETTTYFESVGEYPTSCDCTQEDSTTCVTVRTGQQVFEKSCNGSVTDSLKRNVYTLGGIGLGFAAIQIIPLVLAVLLIVAISRSGADYQTV